jgi:uncharacterized OB-fold protein
MSALRNVPRVVGREVMADIDGVPQLVGSRCASCEAVTFPAQSSCPKCAGQDVGPHRLARQGTLWTFTIQNFPPKTPYLGAEGPFQPYGVGYVDLAGEVIVEARLVADDISKLRIGLPMELVLEPFHRTPDGEAVLTFAFAPVGAAGVSGGGPS